MNAGMEEWHCCSGCMCKEITGHGGPVQHRLEQRCCTCQSLVQGSGLCLCPACWDACLWYQLAILAPFHTAWMAGWMRAIRGANVTRWVLLGQEAHCTTSILWPWSFPLTILRTENPIQAQYWSINSKYCMTPALKCIMAQNWNVCNQCVIEYTQKLAYIYQYIPIHTQYTPQYFLQYRPLDSDQHVLRFNACLYVPNTCQYKRQYIPIQSRGAKTRVINRNSIHAITYQIDPITCQYLPRYIPDTYQIHTNMRLVHGTGFFRYVLACIAVCTGMYCASIWRVLWIDTSQ